MSDIRMEDDDRDNAIEEEQKELTEKELEKKERREKEKERLQEALASGNLDTLISRVAFILNHYSETRNSDMALKLKYWERFQGFTGNFVDVNRMYALERDTSIARARAKIQNEYGLFPSDDRVKHFRKDKEEVEKEIQIATKPGLPTINIYADESGKSGKDKFIVIGGLWILDKDRTEELRHHFIDWRKKHQAEGTTIPKEFHFTKMQRQQLDIYKDLFTEAVSVSDMMGFKAVVMESGSTKRSQDEVIYAMYYQHVHHGIEHEVSSGRITLPRRINFWKDMEEGSDRLFLNELQQHLVTNFKTYFGENVRLDNFAAVSSIANIFIQLADLFTGSVSRVLNQSEGKNHKDEFAQFVIDLLGLDLSDYRNQEHDVAIVHFI